jgi:hypothetical protein
MASKDKTWETYFGKPLIPYERADNQLSHETYNLPKAYEGKNKHLEDVLDFMIRKEDEFYTSRLLPWSFTDELHVQWEIFRFNRTLMDVEPEQGIPRLVTAETERRSDNLLRRGLAFIIEHGFMTTDRGRRHFMMNLQQITDAVHTTAYFGVMHALLSSKQHYKSWLRETDRTSKRPRNLLRHERNNWACVQKTHKGLYVLDAELKHQMKKNSVVPNVWVFPPKMSIYLDMAPKEQTEYQLKGPQAAGNLEEDRSLKGIRWRGTDVFEAATFDIDFVNDDHDLLQRLRQCGEFFVIPKGVEKIKIFSADHDEFKVISRATAWKYAFNKGYLRSDGKIPSEGGGSPHESSSFGIGDDALKGFKKHIGSHVEKAASDLFDFLPKGAKNWKTNKKSAIEVAFPPKNNEFRKGVRKIDSNKDSFKTTGAGGKDRRALERQGNAAIRELSAALHGNGSADKLERDLNLDNLWCCNESEIEQHVVAAVKGIAQAVKQRILGMTQGDLTRDDNILRVARLALLGLYGKLFTAWVWDKIVEEYSQNTAGPKDILIFRPFQTYRMSSAILAAGGRELGETFHGHHDFQLSDDIIRKVHVGHYTHYSKSVVKRPKRYAIAEDIFAQGYVSGEGVEFFTEETLRAALQGDVGTSECKESLISWVIDSGSPTADANALDMRGKFSEQYSEYGDSFFEGSEDLERILNDCEITPEQTDDDIFLSSQYCDNTLCFRGKQFDLVKDGFDNKYFKCTHLGQGHWKGLTYSGCMGVREGTIMSSEHPVHHIGESL